MALREDLSREKASCSRMAAELAHLRGELSRLTSELQVERDQSNQMTSQFDLEKMKKDQEDLLELLADQDSKLLQMRSRLRALGEKVVI